MKHEKIRSFLLGMAVMGCLMMGTLIILNKFDIRIFQGSSLASTISNRASVLESYIDQVYLDKADKKALTDGALKGMVAALGDRYSGYFTKEEYDEIMADIKGVFSGIGATVSTTGAKKLPIILNIMEDSPAQKAGLKAGDVVTKIDGKTTQGLTISQFTGIVHGKSGTKVVLTVLRENKQMNITITRGEIKNKSVQFEMLENKVGYVQISSFDDESPEQLNTAISSLDKLGQKGMIVDLRDNGGGSLTAVVAMLDRMLPKGVIFTVKGKADKQEYDSDDKESFSKPCTILINGNSASASEVFAGSMQDRKAATLVGTKSFGKGIVQSIYPLNDTIGGGAIKLTTAKYYLPSGRCIHKIGLTPDVKLEYTGDKKKYVQSKDNQLQTAIQNICSKIG